MNKDLDDRLIPNGEYRDAQNISVGKSEDDDIGALETILGNELMSNTDLGNANLRVIGRHTDTTNSRMFVFLTDNTNHYIYQFTQPNTYTLLVTGTFLNFSINNPITGISLIEDLLFFTDNVNQPRKINVKKAIATNYYTDESQISVAKYSPYQPIQLVNEIEVVAGVGSTTTNIVLAAANNAILPGMSLITTSSSNVDKILATQYLYVTANVGVNITLNTGASVAPVAGDKLYFLTTTMTGQDISNYFDGTAMPAATTWPGDPDYLESRFVRFSYRFQYDDNEYSIMAPFTQIAYIPKQKGYFLNGDEDETYRSTILEFMENGVQNVKLFITLPDAIANLQGDTSVFKINAIDILYKESDSRAVKVLDTVPMGTVVSEVGSNPSDMPANIYIYEYQSAKPFRTLPENQTVRVYDKVPVLAYSQETAGNRIIYGNFKDKYTPPTSLGYQVGVGPKFTSYRYNSWAEYPNHSVKQNRNYQVGFILADKFGRQSSVILSSFNETTTVIDGITYGGSTVYSPYNPPNETATYPVKDWFGDALRVRVNSPINDIANTTTGTPGLYATARGDGFDVNGATVTIDNTIPTASTYAFTPTAITNIPQEGDYLRGEFTDFVEVGPVPAPTLGVYTITCDGAINKEIYELTGNPGAQVKYAYTLNAKGWYSYKIVVKQNEQEYYNVYLPGIIKGYPFQDPAATNIVTFPTATNTSNIVLFNDNINKIPRDLSEVGPDQKQYRSSVQLFGRVENTMTAAAVPANPGIASNVQFFPRTNDNPIPLTDTAISIASATESNMAFEVFQSYDSNAPILYSTLTTTGQASLYQLESNPLIGRLSTSQDIGADSLALATGATPSMIPYLAVYETEPVDSALDIYWETTQVGLIADLNTDINTDFAGPAGFTTYTWDQPESLVVSGVTGTVLTANVQPVDTSGVVINNTTLLNYSTTNAAIQPVNTSATTGGYNFYINSPFVYLATSSVLDTFTLSMNIRDSVGITSGTLQLIGNLSNTIPTITGGPTLSVITNYPSTSGTIRTLAGLNGSSDITNNTQELQWSITAVDNGGGAYFSLGATSGILTQTGAIAGTYNISIILKDANAGTGYLTSVTATQQVVVLSTTVGFLFEGSATTNQILACPSGGTQPTDCASTSYYSQTALVGGLPPAGAVVLTGPDGPGVSPVAAQGWYSVGACATGVARMVMRIDNLSGIVAVGYPTSCGA